MISEGFVAKKYVKEELENEKRIWTSTRQQLAILYTLQLNCGLGM
jgi:hypothetical protein